ncbi:hypothetical protein [Methanobrevibacter sp.]|uniref:hypothetical protein n=1 Tax=Methanobrevibacter sp. TaxID=66852 RepID=UPI00388E7937
MKKILIAIVLIVVALILSTAISPVMILAEDAEEGIPGVDMAARIGLTGFEWVYPGSSHNAKGETLHNIHFIDPNNPYGAAREIMEYSYGISPHIFFSVNNAAAEAIFGSSIVDDIRANDAYNGYAGNGDVKGTMSRGDAVGTAMANDGMNVFQIPIQLLMGNISIHFG